MTRQCATLDTPLGRYVLVAAPEGILGFQPEGSRTLPPPSHAEDPEVERLLRDARDAFVAYFAGAVRALDRLPLAPGGTPFQRRVWRALREIRAGDTASYGEVARAIGRPGAARAVGMANHHNPIAIAIPCHRVVGSDGRLVGYASGLDRKRWLLAHEGSEQPDLDYAASPKSSVPSARAVRAEARSRESAAASI